jgi:hypothetical protein
MEFKVATAAKASTIPAASRQEDETYRVIVIGGLKALQYCRGYDEFQPELVDCNRGIASGKTDSRLEEPTVNSHARKGVVSRRTILGSAVGAALIVPALQAFPDETPHDPHPHGWGYYMPVLRTYMKRH